MKGIISLRDIIRSGEFASVEFVPAKLFVENLKKLKETVALILLMHHRKLQMNFSSLCPNITAKLKKILSNLQSDSEPLSANEFPEKVTQFEGDIQFIELIVKLGVPLSSGESELLHLLDQLHSFASAELRINFKGLNYVKHQIAQRKAICEELRARIESLRHEYEPLKSQIASQTQTLDLRIKQLQKNFADLEHGFNDSVLRTTTEGVEEYAKELKLTEIHQKHLQAELADVRQSAGGCLEPIRRNLRSARATRYKLESQLESQLTSYEKEMMSSWEKYDTMMKTFRDEEAQLKEYESKISALKVEHEAVLAEQEAQKVREREAAEREARLAENCSVIQAYCRAFLTRREAALSTVDPLEPVCLIDFSA
uniref:Dynein regulatory complex protein 10 n=1 Tax=Mesocestoides corti TaxID=53468 RepID=A0A5K3EJL4_MESCO